MRRDTLKREAAASARSPAVWTEARRRGADLPQLAAWMSAGPASFAGLARRKGRIAPGFDADLVVWDPDASFVPERDQLFGQP